MAYIGDVDKRELCRVGREVLERAREIWELVAPPLGYLAGVHRVLRYAEFYDLLSPTTQELLESVSNDAYRRENYTWPLKRMLEAIYNGSANPSSRTLGLRYVANICGFAADAQYLATRKTYPRDPEEVLSHLEALYDAVVEAMNKMSGLYSSLQDLAGFNFAAEERGHVIVDDTVTGVVMDAMQALDKLETDLYETIEELRRYVGGG